MTETEEPRFTRGSDDPNTLSSGNGIQVHFKDGSSTPRIDIEYPTGHPSRREGSAPLIPKEIPGGAGDLFCAGTARDNIRHMR